MTSLFLMSAFLALQEEDEGRHGCRLQLQVASDGKSDTSVLPLCQQPFLAARRSSQFQRLYFDRFNQVYLFKMTKLYPKHLWNSRKYFPTDVLLERFKGFRDTSWRVSEQISNLSFFHGTAVLFGGSSFAHRPALRVLWRSAWCPLNISLLAGRETWSCWSFGGRYYISGFRWVCIVGMPVAFSLSECPESTKRCFYPRTTTFLNSNFDWELPTFGWQVAFVAGAASPPGLCIALGRLRRCQGTVHHRDMDFGSDPRQEPAC